MTNNTSSALLSSVLAIVNGMSANKSVNAYQREILELPGLSAWVKQNKKEELAELAQLEHMSVGANKRIAELRMKYAPAAKPTAAAPVASTTKAPAKAARPTSATAEKTEKYVAKSAAKRVNMKDDTEENAEIVVNNPKEKQVAGKPGRKPKAEAAPVETAKKPRRYGKKMEVETTATKARKVAPAGKGSKGMPKSPEHKAAISAAMKAASAAKKEKAEARAERVKAGNEKRAKTIAAKSAAIVKRSPKIVGKK